MKQKLITNIILFVMLSACTLFAQVPADQEVIVIEGGFDNLGLLETTINGDVDGDGNRINPNRIYQLQSDEIYYVESPILFGGDNDSTATLNIVGEDGLGKLPIVLTIPKDGGDAFSHEIHGSITLKNLYYPCRTVSDKQFVLFIQFREGVDIVFDNVITEFAGGDLFVSNGRRDIDLFIKNSYLRDMNWFGASWNAGIVLWGADTVWIENTTLTNVGLGFMNIETTEFMYFNHNTMVNATKYGIAKYQYHEAYFTNNLFINMNYEGECSATWWTQTADHQFKGITDIDTIDANQWQTEQGYVPAQEDVKFLSSNNIHFTSPMMQQYYRGDFTPGYDHPISNRSWHPDVTDDMLPIPVENIDPSPIFMSKFTLDLAAAYENIKYNNIYEQVDPDLNTKSVRSQEILEAMVRHSQDNYGARPEGVEFTDEDRVLIAFGDFDPTTLPGVEVENAPIEEAGFYKISDFVEDFSYNADIVSSIDGRKLGALHWWEGGLDGWDSEAELANVKDFYTVTDIKKVNTLPAEYDLAQNYPNPFNPTTIIEFSVPLQSDVQLKVYDILGKEVAVLINSSLSSGSYKVDFDASALSAGIYFYTLSTNDFTATKKMMLLK